MAAPNSFTLNHGESTVFNNVVTGTYMVTEEENIGPAGGFRLMDLNCVDSEDLGIGSTVDLAARTATINLDQEETVTCTFTNIPSVGGNTTFLDDNSGLSGVGIASLVASVVGALVLLMAGGWYARIRWLGDRS